MCIACYGTHGPVAAGRVTELTRAGQIVNNATFQPFLVFGTVAAFYFILCWPLSLLARRMEARMRLAVTR